jgi:hypothetical protein
MVILSTGNGAVSRVLMRCAKIDLSQWRLGYFFRRHNEAEGNGLISNNKRSLGGGFHYM